ncbi:MAG: TIGR01777 family oxidoreductase [Planctomycetota bacterium]|jgi:uncharacterized protein (TIGR01777 family)
MRVIITGATGFIGRALCRELHKDYEVIALSRKAASAQKSLGNWAKVVQWDARTPAGWEREADGALAIINLAGENVASGRWTAARKSRILRSRLDTARAVVDAVKKVPNRPKVVIQGSAIGYYGARQDEPLDEASTPGEGFLANVCRQVEAFAGRIEALGVRCALIRTGIVLGCAGGALTRLMLPFRLYLGGHLGSGRQWFSWIALEDEVAAIRFLMENEPLRGVFNLTAPKPVTMKEFCQILGKVLNRPVWLNVPRFAARLAFGEMVDEMLLSGQRVLPTQLPAAGFTFAYPDVEKALVSLNVEGEEHESV